VFALFDSLLPILSLGITVAGAERLDGGVTTTNLRDYELFAQSYFSLPWDGVFVRPGSRFGFGHQASDGLKSPIRIVETTYKAGADLALLYSGVVVPTVSLQGFILKRSLKLSQPDDVTSNSNLMNRTEWLYSSAVSLGLGVPILDGRILLEPFYRFVQIEADVRQDHLYGFDLSVSLDFQSESSL